MFHGERADRFAAVLDDIACAARDPDLADQREDQVLGRDPCRKSTVDLHRKGARLFLQQALRGEHMPDLGGSDAEGEGAERTVRRGVTVAADDGLPRLRDAELRADDVDDSSAGVLQAQQFDAELCAVPLELPDLLRGRIDGDGRAAEHLLGARRGRVVHRRQGEVGPSHLQAPFAQGAECLR